MHFVFATTALASIAAALPSSPFVVHEKREGDPIAWTKQNAASKDQVLPIRIGLKQQNLQNLYQYVMDVADPDSPNFGKHWSPEKIASTFAPRQQTADETKAWLVNSGIDAKRIKTSAGRNWLEFSATVGEAERLLNTKYFSFKHKESDGTRIASDEYSLPADIQKHVDFVMPTVQLDGLKPTPKSAMVIEAPSPITGLNGTANCKKLTTIDCIRALYGVPVPARGQKPNPYNQMGIAEWADYLYLPDLKAFYKNFTKPHVPQSLEPEFISIDGGKRGDESRLKAGTVVESGLDFMTAISIIYPQNTRLYQVGDGVNVDSVGTFNIFLDALDKSYCSYKGGDQPYIDPAYPDPNDGGYTGPLQCGGAPMSNVFSVSYGQIEGALPRFYQERQCEEWAKLALQGVSVLFASGDSGVANRYNAGYPNSCLDVKDKYVDPNGKRFSPSFPANCPYITAVGATTLLTNDIKDGERAVDRFGSGGGFSDIFVAPDYQKDAVANYLKNYAPPYGDDIFNSSGRGYPDIAALGDTLATVINGTVHGVGGTSASAPLFAGIVTVLNEERLKNGRGPIGFLNPTIYKHPEIFNDVTVGDNPGCGTRGFPASKGWDPVTGMGTPNYEKMRAIFTKLP